MRPAIISNIATLSSGFLCISDLNFESEIALQFGSGGSEFPQFPGIDLVQLAEL